MGFGEQVQVYYMDAGHDERLKKNSTIPNSI